MNDLTMTSTSVAQYLEDKLSGTIFRSYFCHTVLREIMQLFPADQQGLLSCSHIGQSVYISYQGVPLLTVDVHKQISSKTRVFNKTRVEYVYKSFTVYFQGTLEEQLQKVLTTVAEAEKAKVAEVELMTEVCRSVAKRCGFKYNYQLKDLFSRFCSNYYFTYSNLDLIGEENK